MADIEGQQLVYHLTAIDNIGGILQKGLCPRNQLEGFTDVADGEILDSRKSLNLEGFVPFHFFARNPFDGIVQKNHPDKRFILIAVRRTVAKANNWKIIPRHPLAKESVEIFDYDEGFKVIDWACMNLRDYKDAECKSICMAECLSPEVVEVSKFFRIFVSNQEDLDYVRDKMVEYGVENEFELTLNENMFLNKK